MVFIYGPWFFLWGSLGQVTKPAVFLVSPTYITWNSTNANIVNVGHKCKIPCIWIVLWSWGGLWVYWNHCACVCRFCPCDYFWSVQFFAIKLGRMVHHHKLEHDAKKWCSQFLMSSIKMWLFLLFKTILAAYSQEAEIKKKRKSDISFYIIGKRYVLCSLQF